MAKDKISYKCTECGAISYQWTGRCSKCEAWDSIVEDTNIIKKTKAKPNSTINLSDIKSENLQRLKFGINELDRVLGGGSVPGSAILIAGDPGIGKSTLMLQAASKFAEQNKTVLYLAGEESPSQIKVRASRLKSSGDILISSANGPEEVAATIQDTKPSIAIIDSIQSLSSTGYSIGTPAMLRDSVSFIIPTIKKLNTTCFFVGHVTKEGSIAGPKAIEHIVDVVISFEGDNSHSYRLLRATKNRFGPTDEVGVFEMTNFGLEEVGDPSGIFLSAKPKNAAGSVVVPSLQGSRPLLVEVQALVSKSPLAYPRRTALGIDSNRLALLTAVLEKNGGVRLHDQDIFMNVTGGLKLKEPASDLGVAAAMYSSFLNKPIDGDSVFIGEIGLSGEVRPVKNLQSRVKEAEKLGFKKAYIPSSKISIKSNINIIEIKNIVHLMEMIS